MTYVLKDPDATLDYAVDWGADYLTDDVLQSSSWSVSPIEPGGAAIDSSEADELIATVTVGGVKVLGARGSAIAEPSGGAVVDAQARLAVGQILAALRTHGLVAT